MLPPSHLLLLVPNRAIAAAKRLESLIWSRRCELDVEATSPGPGHLGYHEASRQALSPMSPGTAWGKLFDQRWYRLVLPNHTGDAWLQFEEQSEATLYVDGEPYYGFDPGHRRCRLPEGVAELWVQSNAMQSAIWHPDRKPWGRQGARFDGAWLCERDDLAWSVYHDLRCLVQLMLELRTRENPWLYERPLPIGQQDNTDRVSAAYRRLLRWMDRALDAWDTGGLTAMQGKLAEAYGQLRVDKAFSRCVATGHAHIDLVWLWPERIGELKAVHSFASMDRLMDEYPEFRFAYSQPASYEAVHRREPGLMQRIKQRMDSGQWQATGAMYVESDTMLACGEALSRSFEIGQEAFKKLRGEASPLVWLPDVFGYAACLPQLMNLHGVKYFFTTKMTWNSVNRFPHSSFVWKGHDGSSVIAHVVQEIVGYNGLMNNWSLRVGEFGHQQGDVHHEFLMPTGYGDGGGGPTDEMCEHARRLSRLVSLPEVVWDHPEAFFERMQLIRDELPTHEGECYLEFHRGIFTTHRQVKDSFRGLERALQIAEAVGARLGRPLGLEHAWKRAVFFQFHDYIPGSSVWDVYAEGVPESRELIDSLMSKATASLEADAGRASESCLFNPHACTVRHLMPDGERIVELPPLSGTALHQTEKIDVQPVRIDGRTVSNGLTRFELDANGHVTRLAWPEGEAKIAEGFAGLMLYPDRAANCEPWDIDRHTLSLGRPCDEPATISEIHDDAGLKGLSVKRKVGRSSEAEIRLLLEPGSAELHVEVHLDWQDPEHLLKLMLPTRYRARQARFGGPFGSVLRSQVADGMVSAAMWEVPFSRYLSVFEEGEADGLAVVSESVYGATVYEGVAGISLVRSPRVTGRESHADAWPAHLSRLADEAPVYCDLGRHTIRLALGWYGNSLPAERHPASLADTLYTPAVAYQGVPMDAVFSVAHCSATVVPAWIKPLPDGGWLIRLHEVGGRSGAIELRAREGWAVAEAAFDGTPCGDASETLCQELNPSQIVTVVVKPITG